MAANLAEASHQYYASYPVTQGIGNVAPTYHQQAAYSQHLNHHNHHYHQQHQNLGQHGQQHQQLQPYQHHSQQVAAAVAAAATTNQTAANNPNSSQIGQNQRPVSASTNSSAALYSMEATKSTKGASKLRRDLINRELDNLREQLPLSPDNRKRLSHLELMALVLNYVRKSNYFCNAFRNYGIAREPSLAFPTKDFLKSLNGFLMMLTQRGKLLYISNNADDYLGHSMEEILSNGDEVYDFVVDQDKKTIRTELLSNEDEGSPSSKSSVASLHQSQQQQQQSGNFPTQETRIALCRMRLAKNSRRQMRLCDQKVLLIEGHYFGYLPLSSRDEPVFWATCTPIAMPETRESIFQGSTNAFTSIHSMDMKFLYIDAMGEHHLNCSKQQIHGTSWYELVHNEHLHEAQARHKRITANEQERSTIVLMRMMSHDKGSTIWVHSVMQVKEAADSAGQPVIVCTNQVLSERQAQVMRANSWLYQFYSPHSKLSYKFAAGSPLSTSLDQPAATPSSDICALADEAMSGADQEALKAPLGTIKPSAAPKPQVKEEEAPTGSSKSPPANNLIAAGRRQQLCSPDQPASGQLQEAYAGYPSAYSQSFQASAKSAGKLSLLTQPESGSYPATTGAQKSYHQLTSGNLANQLMVSNRSSADFNSYGQTHHHSAASTGSSTSPSSASSSSSASSTSSQQDHHLSTTPNGSALVAANLSAQHHGVAPSLAVAAAAAAAGGSPSTAVAAAASLYAGIDAMAADPLQHMHHPGANAGSMYPSVPAAAAHHHAAVNYASQVMAAQRVGHHHHHPYHPYHHHQHHPVHSGAHHGQHHQTSHVAPHHHQHHTSTLYGAPNHHHHHRQMAASAASNAFNHHHAAAYHSAAAVRW